MRPHGRSLSDFEPLWAAERDLLEHCRMGKWMFVGEANLPEEDSDANRIRADFVRFLALGGDAKAPVHEGGVRLMGGWISGPLDLAGAHVGCRLFLINCRLERVDARHSDLKYLNLGGCRLEGEFAGDSLHCATGLFLRRGCHVSGGVVLNGARLGLFDCHEGRFENAEGATLACDNMVVEGEAMCSNMTSTGEVRLLGAKIGANLDLLGAVIENPGGTALNADRVQVSGTLFLNNGFHSVGMSRLVSATIGSDLNCAGGHFENPEGIALTAERTRIEGSLFFVPFEREDGTKVPIRVEGGLDLSGAHATMLVDEADAWSGAAGQLHLDGFTYDRMGGEAPTSAQTRFAWLGLQSPYYLGEGFRPQPWEQLAKVLRDMGHPDEARSVAIEKQRRIAAARRLPRGAGAFHAFYGALVGFGYRPMRLVAWTVGVWLLWSALYWAATNPIAGRPHLLAPPPARDGKTSAPDYRNFVPLIYSADVLLPVVDLGYKDEWQPVVGKDGEPLPAGQLLRFLYWFEIAFGWVAGLLLVGVLGNLIKKD